MEVRVRVLGRFRGQSEGEIGFCEVESDIETDLCICWNLNKSSRRWPLPDRQSGMEPGPILWNVIVGRSLSLRSITAPKAAKAGPLINGGVLPSMMDIERRPIVLAIMTGSGADMQLAWKNCRCL